MVRTTTRTTRAAGALVSRYIIVVPGHPLSPNGQAAAPLRTRLSDKRAYRDMVAWQVRAAHRGPPLERARVTITLLRTDSQFYDPDAAVGTCKRLVDGLVHGGLLVDDSKDHIELVVRQERGDARSCRIVVEALT